jgi:hypothetical protein
MVTSQGRDAAWPSPVTGYGCPLSLKEGFETREDGRPAFHDQLVGFFEQLKDLGSREPGSDKFRVSIALARDTSDTSEPRLRSPPGG